MEKVIEFFFGNIFIVSRCNNASLNIFILKINQRKQRIFHLNSKISICKRFRKNIFYICLLLKFYIKIRVQKVSTACVFEGINPNKVHWNNTEILVELTVGVIGTKLQKYLITNHTILSTQTPLRSVSDWSLFLCTVNSFPTLFTWLKY